MRYRLVGLGIAILITVVGFYFWLVFGQALGVAMKVVYADEKPAKPSRSGPVEVMILKPGKEDCTKERPCPETKPK